MNIKERCLKLLSYVTSKPIYVGTNTTVDDCVADDVSIIPMSRLSVKYELIPHKFVYHGAFRTEDVNVCHRLYNLVTGEVVEVTDLLFKQLFRKPKE